MRKLLLAVVVFLIFFNFQTSLAGKTNDDIEYIPIRELSDLAGFTIKWSHERKEVFVSNGERQAVISVGSTELNVNQETILLEHPPVLENQRFMLPVNAVEKMFGYTKDELLSNNPYHWSLNQLIAHAGGGIDWRVYTNSLESFELNYQQGYRLFEVDFAITSDDQLVLRHGWIESENLQTLEPGMTLPLSKEKFKQLKIYDKYTPMDLHDLIDLMAEYPDMFIVTDTKIAGDWEAIRWQFEEIVHTANERGEDIVDRIIPQLYNSKMLDVIKDVYPFKSYIFTLYATNESNEQVIDFVTENGIKAVTMSTARFSEEFAKNLNAHNIKVYVHTINDLNTMYDYMSRGVHGFYSDFVLPDQLIEQ